MPEDHLTLEYDSVGFNFDAIATAIQSVFAFFGFGSHANVDGGMSGFDSFFSVMYGWWQVYSIFAFLLSALFLYGIVYARIKLGEQAAEYHRLLHQAEEEFKRLYVQHEAHGKFEAIQNHAASDNPNDWRLAIIEADIVLEELLEEHGIHGVTIGDRLKSVNEETLRSLNDAWEAHKVRNEIAHRGGDFILTKKIANETLAQYRRVFDELHLRDAAYDDRGHH